MILRELKIGDEFYHESYRHKKSMDIYKVSENCIFNFGHGSSTRICFNNNTRKFESKSCNLKVIKIEFPF